MANAAIVAEIMRTALVLAEADCRRSDIKRFTHTIDKRSDGWWITQSIDGRQSAEIGPMELIVAEIVRAQMIDTLMQESA